MSDRNQDDKAMKYWNEVRVKKLSTNSKWLDEVYDDVHVLIDLSKTKGVSDGLRLNFAIRCIEALEEVKEFLKN